MDSRLKRFLHLDWDAIAGIVAAVIALVMHFLHVIEEDVLLMMALVLLALLFIRDLRRERQGEQLSEILDRIESTGHEIKQALTPPDAVLIGPLHLRAESERFARHAHGEMVWFHVCLLMFKSQPLFDILLRPAIENPKVTRIHFTLDTEQMPLWKADVLPKIQACSGAAKVPAPNWTEIDENVSFIISGIEKDTAGECLLSFWGEPFMSQIVGRSVPRYIFHVQEHSELVTRFAEMERAYRIQSSHSENQT